MRGRKRVGPTNAIVAASAPVRLQSRLGFRSAHVLLIMRARCPLTQTGHEQPNHCHCDERFARLHLALIVFAHPAIPRDPSEGPFHNPTFREHGEATDTRRTLHYFEVPVTLRFALVGQFLASVGRISPNLREAWDKVF